MLCPNHIELILSEKEEYVNKEPKSLLAPRKMKKNQSLWSCVSS